jgi:tetratricopeptide (TPR) repeat protein
MTGERASPPDSVETLLRDAFTHINAGRKGIAIQLLSLAFKEANAAGSGQEPHIYNLLWNLYHTVTPDTAGVSEGYVMPIAAGNQCRAEGDQATAIRHYEEAVQIKPRLPFAYSCIANAYAFLGDHAAAHRNFAQAAKLIEGWRESIVNLDEGFLRDIAAKPARSVVLERRGSFTHQPGDLVVVIGCDSTYYRRFAAAMIASIRERGGARVTIHVHLVDPEPEILADAAARTARDSGINYTWERLTERNFLLETYYACARFLRMSDVFDLYGDAVEYLILDIDAVVMADLRAAICRPTSADITFVRDDAPATNVWVRLLAGAIHVARPAKARAYFIAVARYVEEFYRKPHNRFLDQIALYAAAANKQVLSTVPEIGAFDRRIVSERPEDNPPLLYFYASRTPATLETTSDGVVARAE